MSGPQRARWLQVAKRASEFRLLIGSAEVAEATHRANAAEESLRASESLGQQARQAWRNHLSKPSFHALDDAQFRGFQHALVKVEIRQGADAERAREELLDAQRAMRRELAEKNALLAAVEHVRERTRLQQVQRGQRDADEVWARKQYGTGDTP